MAYQVPPQGQKVMASSMGVVIASDQTPVSVAGTVNIGNQTGSIAAWLQSTNASVITVPQGSVGAVIIGGSIAASFTPPANQSVSGVVQVQGTQTTAATASANPVQIGGRDVDGSVVAASFARDGDQIVHLHSSIISFVDNAPNQIQTPVGDDDTTFIVQPTYGYMFDGATWDRLRGNSTNGLQTFGSVSGTVGASVVGHAPVVIVGGSVAASFTPPANQSVSGTVGASVIGTVPITQSGTIITSIVSTVPSSVIVGASIFGLAPVNVTNTNINVGGSVAAWLQSTNASVITVGSPVANQSVSGTVGASIIGLVPVSVSNFPTTQNVSGSVVASQTNPSLLQVLAGLQSTNASVITVGSPVANQSVSGTVGASVIGTVPVTQSGTVITSIIGAYAEDTTHATGDIGVATYGVRNDTVASFVGTNLDYTPIATDSSGRTLVRPFAAEEARIEGYQSVVSASVTTLVAAAGAGLRNYVTDVMIANTGSSTTLVTFSDGAGSILGYTIAPAGGGSNMIGMQTPIRTGVNATFDFQATTSTSILFATVKGYKAP